MHYQEYPAIYSVKYLFILISILLAFLQNRIDKILHFTLSVFSWHFIRIKPNIKYVSIGMNNLRFQIEMTLGIEI